MNCKPGDLAVIVVGAQSSGRIVRCVRLLSGGETVTSKCGQVLMIPLDLTNCWLIDGHALLRTNTKELYWAPAVSDSCLKPIRDQGDDATDESHAWLPPVPSNTKETA